MGLPLADYQVVYLLSEEQVCLGFNRATPGPLIDRFQQALDRVIATPAFLRLMENYLHSPAAVN